jgi:hypothetical protein
MNSPKDYLGFENARNKQFAKLFEDMIRAAYGHNNDVLIGHHLTFEQHGNIATENEIPAADTLIFDHELMGRVFGPKMYEVIHELAMLPVERRDARLSELFYSRRPVL